MNKIYRLGELFCGPGGIALGAKNANIKKGKKEYSISHAWATDYDKDTCETYKTNICPKSKKSDVHKDIRKLDIETQILCQTINTKIMRFLT